MTSGHPMWDILIPTLGERRALFDRLMGVLMPQVDAAGGRVRVVGWFNNGEPTLADIRQRMILDPSRARYVSFVDDDDLVSPDYVPEILAALDLSPDYVGFQVQCYSDGNPVAVAYHDLDHGRWVNLSDRYLRDISHLNPIRTTLARRADFRRSRRGSGEDRVWAEQIRRGRVLRDQVVIPRIMYHYLHTNPGSATGSRWRNPRMIRVDNQRSTVSGPNFLWSDHA